jgi:hypothetical protein
MAKISTGLDISSAEEWLDKDQEEKNTEIMTEFSVDSLDKSYDFFIICTGVKDDGKLMTEKQDYIDYMEAMYIDANYIISELKNNSVVIFVKGDLVPRYKPPVIGEVGDR